MGSTECGVWVPKTRPGPLPCSSRPCRRRVGRGVIRSPAHETQEPVRAGGDAGEVHSAGGDLDEKERIESTKEHGVDGQEVASDDGCCLAVQELLPGKPARLGSMPSSLRIDHTVLGAIAIPRCLSSPWIRLYPQVGLSSARRITS